MAKTYKIAVIPGDGTGPEVTAEALKVLAAVAKLEKFAFETQNFDWGGERYLKTGETLLKSVLAPMFAKRNLRVLSWVGHNILGNRDGLVLSDPHNKASKVRTMSAWTACPAGVNSAWSASVAMATPTSSFRRAK